MRIMVLFSSLILMLLSLTVTGYAQTERYLLNGEIISFNRAGRALVLAPDKKFHLPVNIKVVSGRDIYSIKILRQGFRVKLYGYQKQGKTHVTKVDVAAPDSFLKKIINQ